MLPKFINFIRTVNTVDRKLSQLGSVVWYDLSWRLAPPGTFRQRFEQAIVNMPQGICLYDAQDRLQWLTNSFAASMVSRWKRCTWGCGSTISSPIVAPWAIIPDAPSKISTGSGRRTSTAAGRTLSFRNSATAD